MQKRLKEKLRTEIWYQIHRVIEDQSYDVTMDVLDQIIALHEAALRQAATDARIEENQIPLDRINNYKPDPSAPSFGSASGAIGTAGWKHYFEDRIAELRSERQAGTGKE